MVGWVKYGLRKDFKIGKTACVNVSGESPLRRDWLEI